MKVRYLSNYVGQDLELDVAFKNLTGIILVLFYYKEGDEFKVVSTKDKVPLGVESHELEIKVDFEGMFGGPLVYFYDHGAGLLNLKRASAASLAIHLPKGGVSARDGIGDWSKGITLSKQRLDV